VELVRKATLTPARLAPADLEPVRAAAGDDALDYAVVLANFHFINRVADLLHVDPDALPDSLRRFELVRRLAVRATSVLMRRMDLHVRPYTTTFAGAVAGARVGSAEALAPIAARPKIVELLELAVAERERSTLPRDTVARVQRVVEAALPAQPEEAEGFHPRPTDPVDAFAFVGTRYAARTTEAMIAALRQAGYDDVGILDLAIAVASANQWARLHRLVGLAPGLFYVAGPSGRAVA
jgi:hypothetical protein